jgi:type II secretory pathway component PulJ
MSARRDPAGAGQRTRRAVGRWLRRSGGTTLLELMVACFIALIFTLAAGTAYLVNQKAYRRNQDKLALQQMVTQNMEIMERKIRSAARAGIVSSPARIRLFDRSGTEITNFKLQNWGVTNKLLEGSQVMAEQSLINLQFIPNADTTVVTVVLELQDAAKNKVALRSSATLRNHLKFAHLGS